MKNQFTIDHARRVGNQLDIDWSQINIEQFLAGMNVELEHGLVHEKTNITNDNDLLTGKIALAHLNEDPEYYKKLEQDESEGLVNTEHYYGDVVRQMFMVGAMIMVLSLPLVKDKIALPLFLSLIAIVGLGLAAGMTNPRQRAVIWVNTAISAFALAIFEYYAIKSFSEFKTLFFIANQLLALLFLAALYFSTKTLRGMLLK